MTVTQKQCLLTYLGYDTGGVDGIWGEKSREATVSFQKKQGMQADGVFGEETEKKILEQIISGDKDQDFWEDIRYFSREEFRCKCGGQYCSGEPAVMREDAVRIAEAARIHFGRPARVVSGLRCRQWNKIQGGVENSQHMYGEAVDLCIPGVSSGELLSFLQTQPIRYAYAINDTNVHFDVAKGVR